MAALFNRAESTFAALAALAMLVSCREGVDPYSPPVSETIVGATTQLTFGFGQDRDPSWAPGSDSLLYHTSASDAVPNAAGALMRISANGGVAVPVLPDVQALGNKMLASPVYSPNGDRIAYLDVVNRDGPVQCAPGIGINDSPATQTIKLNCRINQPVLDSVVLRVRRVGEVRPADTDPSIRFKTEGTSYGQVDYPLLQRVFPFQLQYNYDNQLLLRAAWSPDGQRIAFTDGLRIHIWQVGAATTTVLPGSGNGVSPAWSRDGARIAFTALERGDSALNVCSCAPFAAHNRWVYTVTARKLVVMNVDGSNRLELGTGEDPAWSPDGQSIFAVRNQEITRISYPGGAAVAVPNTQRARAPAISSDGKLLAFARSKTLTLDPATFAERFDWDIWVARLSQ